MSKRGGNNQQQNKAAQQPQVEEQEQKVEQQEQQAEQQPEQPEAQVEQQKVVEQEAPEEEAQTTQEIEEGFEEEMALHEGLEVKAFTQQLDEYAARYVRKPAQPKDDLDAHMKLHAAVRNLLKASPKVQRVMFGAFVQRISDSKNGEYQLPTIVKHLTNPKVIQSKHERVFLAEFLTLMSKYGRLQDKTQIHKEANVSRVFESISDTDLAKRLMDLFPSK